MSRVLSCAPPCSTHIPPQGGLSCLVLCRRAVTWGERFYKQNKFLRKHRCFPALTFPFFFLFFLLERGLVLHFRSMIPHTKRTHLCREAVWRGSRMKSDFNPQCLCVCLLAFLCLPAPFTSPSLQFPPCSALSADPH